MVMFIEIVSALTLLALFDRELTYGLRNILLNIVRRVDDFCLWVFGVYCKDTRRLADKVWSTVVFCVAAASICGLMCLKAQAAKPAEECLSVLERNFAAMNEKDIGNLMKTLAPSTPRDAAITFHEEAQAVFRDTDVHLSLGDYQFLGVQGPFAAARVVQYTTVAAGGQPTEYRQASHLLPADPAVTYVQIFRRERGKWYLWRSEDERALKPACASGRCQPTVTVRLD